VGGALPGDLPTPGTTPGTPLAVAWENRCPEVVMTLHRPRLALGLILLLTGATPAVASDPAEMFRTQIDRLLQVLGDPARTLEERRAAARLVASEVFDFGETARRALGVHWQPRTPDERAEFVRLFRDLLERAYLSKVELYGGEKLEVLGSTVDGDEATVRTRVLGRQAEEIPVDYRMLRSGGGWKVYDVTIAGVSLVANYRAQFNKIIRMSSYGELMARLRTKEATPGRQE